LDVKDDLELELRLRRIEAALEGKLNSNEEDEQSGSRSTVPQVTGLRVVGQTPGAVTISWNPVAIPNLRRYDVEFSESTGFTNKQTFSENTTQHTFITASETGGGGGATWFARVRAVNVFKQTGQYSVTLNLTTGQAQTEDLAPGSVTTVQITPGGVAASAVSYENATSGLTADDVQEAIDELATASFTESFNSGQQSTTAASLLTLSHGLSGTPLIIHSMLENLTADVSFSPGDVVHIGASLSSAGQSGLVIWADATDIFVRFSNTALQLHDQSSGVLSNLTNSRWALVVTAYR